MIQANELRIGNLFNREKYGLCEYRRSHKLAKFQMVDVYSFSSSGKIGGYEITVPISDLEPIHVTEELLLKFGYLPCNFRDNYFVISGHSIWKCNDLFMCDKNGIVLKWVHQLQNLHFALTHQELTLEDGK